MLASTILLRARGRRQVAAHVGRELRQAFEDLGLTYLKLGQFLAMRGDVLPLDVCRELQALFEHVKPVPYPEVRRAVEYEIGVPLDLVFDELTVEPLASASVAQVHAGRTVRGARVAVKVQRPGIEPVLRADIRNLLRVAALVDRLGLLNNLSATTIARQFADWTLRELDFEQEGRTADRLRENALPYEVIPRIHWELSTKRVLVMELIDGLSVSALTEVVRSRGERALAQALPGIDLELAARRLAWACLNQLFNTGFFHGDPHPGNIIVLADNRVAFVDFGIFGTLGGWHRGLMAEMIESLALGDDYRAFWAYHALSDPSPDTDLRAYERAGREALRTWYLNASDPHAPPELKQLGRYAGEMTDLARRHGVRTDWATLLFWRALNALDSTAVQLPEYLDLLGVLRDFFEETRGNLADRVADIVEDPGWQRAVEALASDVPRSARWNASPGAREVSVETDESRAACAASNRAAKEAAACLLGVAGVLAAGSGGGAPLAIAALVITLAPAVSLLVRPG